MSDRYKKGRKEYLKAYRLKNGSRLYLNNKRYRLKHKERVSKKCHEYYVKNKDRILKRCGEYRSKNRLRYRRLGAIYHSNNKVEIKEYARKYAAKRRILDPKFKLRNNISRTMRYRLHNRLASKNGKSTFSFLPYTIEQLMSHLEKQFQDGMTWKNYGKWHLDHRLPDSSFDYKSVEDPEFQKCWSLENLQPLWAHDNLVKSNKVIV